MPFITANLILALPELFVTFMGCVLLIVDVYLRQDQRHITYRLTQFILLGAAVLTWFTFAEQPTAGFYGHYIRDPFADTVKLGIYLTSAAVFLYSRDYLKAHDLFRGEYFILGLFGVLGMMILVSGHSFLTIYLGLELLSLCLYALVAFDTDSPVAAEAAMKYFVLGTLASGMFLYGVSMVYGATGSFNLQIVGAAVAEQNADNLVLVFGLVFLVAGLAFKLGAVPFHMWLPDVYQGAPTPVTLYVAAAPKLAAFVLTIRILVDGLTALQEDWQGMLIILAVLSIGLGNLIAIVQTNIKRLLAYSTISHVGFLLLGILVGTPQGYGAALFYAMTYVLMVVGVFGIILLSSRSGFEAENIDDLKGLNDHNPWLAFLMLLLLMSLAGMPVLVGFYAKLVVLQAIIGAGFIGLAIYAVLFTVIGVYYYLRVVKAIYFDKPETAVESLHIRPDVHLAISANGLLVLVLGLYPTWLLTVCSRVF